MTRAPLLAIVAVATAGAVGFIPQQATAVNGCGVPFDGTTYLISTPTQLRNLALLNCNPTYNVRVLADIDLSDAGELTPFGDFAAPYQGTFDGGGHRITGLQMTSPGRGDFGLLGRAEGATIRNVSVTGTVLGPGYMGGGLLVGHALNTTISNVTVSGTVRAQAAAGGVTGILAGGSLTDASAGVVATGDAGAAGGAVGSAWVTRDGSPRLTRVRSDGSVTSDSQYAGGLVGSLVGATVTGSSSTAWVRGVQAGGLVGHSEADGADTSITDSYATGQVMGAPAGAEAVGGIVGVTCTARPTSLVRTYFAGGLQPNGARSGGIVGDVSVCTTAFAVSAVTQGNVWNTDTSGASGGASDIGEGRTTTQMKQLATYTALGWSMVNGWEAGGSSTWGICPQVNDGYPFLQSTGAGSSCTAPASVPVTAPPVLEATLLPSRRRVVSGQAVRIGIRTSNTGGAAATSAVSCVRLPAKLVLVRAPGATRSGRLACFQLGTVAAKAQATRLVTARAATLHRATVTVTGAAKASGLTRVAADPATITVRPRAARARVTG